MPTPATNCQDEYYYGYTCTDTSGIWGFIGQVSPSLAPVTAGWEYYCGTPFGTPGVVARIVVPCGTSVSAPPVSPNAQMASLGCCDAYFCNCTYTSTYNCSTGLWSTATLVSPCTSGLIDLASAWAVTSGCNAETTVSDVGSCDPT